MTTRVLWHPAHLHTGALRASVGPRRTAGLLHHVGSMLHTWRRRVRERDQLARMDERMLADIGITRGDAEFLINKPFWKE